MYFFDKNPAFAGHTLFIENSGKSVVYQDWYDHADKLHDILRPRSVAAILCHNTIGSALAYLCCLQNRVVPLLMDNKMDRELRDNLLILYKPAYVFKPLSDACPSETPLYTLEDYGLYKHSDQAVELFPDLGLLLTTSGSTGSPKLVRQSYKNIQANANSIATYLELTDKDRPVSSLPMHYTFGLSVINSHMTCGATECLTDDTVFDASFWKFIKDQHVTSMAGVPFTYECLKKIRFFRMDLPELTLMLQAGGKLSKVLHKEYATYATEQGKRFIVMYGQAEATARMSYLPMDKSLEKIGSIGIAIPGGKFRIMEDMNKEITETGVNGELCYDGPNVTLGYATCAEDLSRGDERHGRLWTGDIAYKDEDGFFYISGRKKRFVKIMGKRVSMDEIEQLFKNAFTDYDFACTGEDDDLRIFTTADASQRDRLEDFLIKKTSLHPATFSIRTIDAIPKNSSGKTQYPLLKEL